MLQIPNGGLGNFAWRQGSHQATRPAAAFGTTVTPAQNTKGSYSSSMLTAARDAYGILINANSNAVTTAARDTILDIGVDPAGGTAYTVLIPDLLVSAASPYNIGSGGIWYYFPVWIKSGSTVAARASVNNATVGTLSCNVTLFGSPKDRRLIRVGTFVKAIGITSASSSGTAVTSGTTSEGSWTSLGSIANHLWWWQLGMGCSDGTMSANIIYHGDLSLGDASNKRIVVQDQLWISPSNAEQFGNVLHGIPTCEYDVPASGVTAYGRLQCSGTADAGLSLAAYGVGGG